jgi:hypothetical protein
MTFLNTKTFRSPEAIETDELEWKALKPRAEVYATRHTACGHTRSASLHGAQTNGQLLHFL